MSQSNGPADDRDNTPEDLPPDSAAEPPAPDQPYPYPFSDRDSKGRLISSLTYSAAVLPPGLSIDPNAGLIPGPLPPAPGMADATETSITVSFGAAPRRERPPRKPNTDAGPDKTAGDACAP